MKKKRKKLIDLTEKIEVLTAQVELFKQEYSIRIGSLYAKDNHLDWEIIRFKNICRLMESGVSYEDALKQIEESFFYDSENEEYGDQYVKFEEEMQALITQEQPTNELKNLWKKLIMQFHPDLVTDKKEKSKREDMVKKINKAYRERDFEALTFYEKHFFTHEIIESTMKSLEKILVDIENSLLQIRKKLIEIRQTEWYIMKKKFERAKHENIDMYKELEDQLLDDIARKSQLLRRLKQQATKVETT